MVPGRIVGQLLGIDTVRRQALISIGANVGITAVGYLATVYIAHAAGAGVLGAYFLFLAYYSFASLASDGGMGGAAVKKISEGKDEEAYFTAHIVIKMTFLLATITIITLFLSPLMMDFNQAGLLPWLIAALMAGSLGGMVSTGVYGGGSVGALQVAEFMNTLARVGVQVCAVYAGFAVMGMAGGFIAGIIAAGAINLHFLRFRPGKFGWRHIRAMAPIAMWMFLTGAAGILTGYADTVLVGYYLNSEEVGYYRAPLQLAILSLFAATSLSTALYPRISRWWEESDTESATYALCRATTYSLLLAVPFTVGGLILGERLLYFLYGSPFTVATVAFSILLLAQVGSLFFTLDAMVLGAMSEPRHVFLSGMVSAAILVVLEIALIPILGITGAAAALFMACSVRAGISRILVSRRLSVALERGAVRHIVMSAVLMAAVVIALRFLLPVTHVAVLIFIILVGAATYFLALFRLDAGIRSELKDLGTLLGLPWPSWL